MSQRKQSATSGNKLAPKGKVWVCCACGKTSMWRYGFSDERGRVVHGGCTSGWDESCVLNCNLFDVADITDPANWKPWERVRRIGEPKVEVV